MAAKEEDPIDQEKYMQRVEALLAKVDDRASPEQEQRTAALKAVQLIKRGGLRLTFAQNESVRKPKTKTVKRTTAPVTPEDTLTVTAEDHESLERYIQTINRKLKDRTSDCVDVYFNVHIRLGIVHWLANEYKGWRLTYRYSVVDHVNYTCLTFTVARRR